VGNSPRSPTVALFTPGLHTSIKLKKMPFTVKPGWESRYYMFLEQKLKQLGFVFIAAIADKMASLFSVSAASPTGGFDRRNPWKSKDTKSVEKYKNYWKLEVQKNIMTVSLKPEYSYIYFQEVGIGPHPMTHLIGKTIPFVVVNDELRFAGPGTQWAGKQQGIIADVEKEGATYNVEQTPQGKVIFRKVTEESIQRGSWRHPGYPGKGFFRSAIKETLTAQVQQIPNIVFEAKTDADGGTYMTETDIRRKRKELWG